MKASNSFEDLAGISSQTAHRPRDRPALALVSPLSAHARAAGAPCEVFPPWRRAQLEVARLACEARLPASVLRTTGFLPPQLAERVTDWFTGEPTAPENALRRSYEAFARETARLFEIVCRGPASGGLGVRVQHVHSASPPYRNGAELCAELRRDQTTKLTTIARREPHPLLGQKEGGVLDQLLVVHGVLGHAALGVGFDLQSELATWLQCRTLFSPQARGAAFCELVGERPPLRADLPPAELLAACHVDAHTRPI
jgi:hypothetical protein